MTASAPPVCYRFARFELQPYERRLLATGKRVNVDPRAFDLLVALIERNGHLVTKGELLDRLWPTKDVIEANLYVHVSALRKILGQDAIETIAGHGYRFALVVTYVGVESPTSAETPKHNLPQQLTSFIGREKEIAEVTQLLCKTRLLTLTGAGGCGKTRLAMQVAAGLLECYPDGVWFVELAPLSDPGLVPQTVATVLGLREKPKSSLTQSLTEHLMSKHLLLLLDNAEHLLSACVELADLVLGQCPRVVMVATSRERLGMTGELTYRVPSLSIPDPKRDATPDRILEFESVRLFIERAQFQLPQFAVTHLNAPALASVCHRLDGMPLALELAAARVRAMSVEEVDLRLDQRFRLLTGGSRVLPRRHQTLRSLIEWSCDLLTDAEKALLWRASLFSGGWTAEAAEQVCSGEGIDEWEALDLLTSLADKNLVVAEEQSSATRYRMLETVRQFARDRLRDSGEEAQWLVRHLAYFLALAEEAEPQLTGADQQAWLDRLEMEHDNLRSALAWSCLPRGDVLGGLRLAGAVWWFWSVRGYLSEGRDCLSRLFAASPCGQPSAARAKALNGAGALAYDQSDYAAARVLYEESLAIKRELDDQPGIARSLNNLGNLISDQGDYLAARTLYEESLAIKRKLGDRKGIAHSLNNFGLFARDQGDNAAARALLEEGLAIRRELGDQWGVASSLNNLGNVVRSQGNYLAARELFEQSLAIQRELNDRHGIATSLNNLAIVASDHGDYAAAFALYEESLPISRELGDRRGVADSLEGLASVAFMQAGPRSAARIWGAAERIREEIGCPVPPSERPRYDRQVADARAVLSDPVAFDSAWEEGRAMTTGQAIECALARRCG